MTEAFLRPVAYDKKGPMFSSASLTKDIVKMIKCEDYFYRRAKTMNQDIQKAEELTNLSINKLGDSITRLLGEEEKITASTKVIAGKIKDTTQKLSDGVAKIESRANFDRLERYVLLLERAEKAMSSLAELESSGRLEKIAGALK